ncbi:unnamed protein product [Polarella glacialis]|uniref:Uncharacterized protein n=1 Tax=Polarella glacialis TaxID=89957 RepID=A0A813GBV9_POLGL|nr:unnamed protein product [Polarella glacialis]
MHRFRVFFAVVSVFAFGLLWTHLQEYIFPTFPTTDTGTETKTSSDLQPISTDSRSASSRVLIQTRRPGASSTRAKSGSATGTPNQARERAAPSKQSPGGSAPQVELLPSCPGPAAAFCFFGQPRSLMLPIVHVSVRRNLIDAFGAPHSDTFCLFKLAAPVENNGTAVRKYTASSKVELAAAEEVLQPLRIRYLTHEEQKLPEFDPPGKGMCELRIWQQQVAKAACFKMIQEEEGRLGCRYSYVFLVRPDLLWVRRFPKFTNFENEAWEGATIVRDLFQMLTRKTAEAYFKVPLTCVVDKTSSGETFMAVVYSRSLSNVRYQCMPGHCDHDMDAAWVHKPHTLPDWRKWACLQPCTLMRIEWDPAQSAIRADMSEWGCADRSGCNLAFRCERDRCKRMESLSHGEAVSRVEFWGAAPLCEGPCHADILAEGKRLGKKAAGVLQQCEDGLSPA